MRWKKYRLTTRTEAEDLVIASLAEAGVEGVEIEDHVPLTEEEKKQMFVDILPDGPEDDGTAYLSFYLDAEEDHTELLERVREELESLRMFTDIGSCRIEESLTEDKDWINNWKEYFHQFTVGDFLIVPSWEEVREDDRNKQIIHIDPGSAFGTGLHETTQLCLRQLIRYVKPGMRILDVGTGSGILAIAARKLGASYAMGTDLDPCAITAVKENLEANDIPEDYMDIVLGNLIDDPEVQNIAGKESFDLVTANILAEVLVLLTPEVVSHMKPGGWYVTSGILKEKGALVRAAMEKAGLEVVEETSQNDWVCLTARKPC